jgi:D-tyrosyl-tRNA(Tyr) deacylase
MMVLLGVGDEDNSDDVRYLADKILNLRIFDDEQGKMNNSLTDVKGDLLVVSQFTLFGDCRKGRRPSYDKAAKPKEAQALYNEFVNYCKDKQIKVETGRFQAEMTVEINNDGPVTLLIDSKKTF